MQTRIQKWGNSLALRIPKSFAAEVRLEQDTRVEISVRDGLLVIQPVAASRPTLDELLAGVTEANIHGEIDYGPACGNELW